MKTTSGSRSKTGLRVAGIVLLAAMLGGCGRAPEEDELYEEIRRQEEQQRQTATREQQGVDPEAEAILMVKAATAVEGSGTTEEWLQRQMDAGGDHVFFPRWKAYRRGTSKLEVTYTYTFADKENAIMKKGYAWNVDLVLGQAGPMREMRDDELSSRVSTRVRRSREAVTSDIPRLE